MSASSNDERLIVAITKNAREEIRIERGPYMGRDVVNVRVWFKDETGPFRPGKSGLGFRADLLDAMIAALVAMKNAGGAE